MHRALAIINKVDFDELIKLEVISVRKYDYKFKYNNKIIHKNIEFYSNTKPKVGDYIYVSLETIGDDMLSYGHIKNINESTEKLASNINSYSANIDNVIFNKTHTDSIANLKLNLNTDEYYKIEEIYSSGNSKNSKRSI